MSALIAFCKYSHRTDTLFWSDTEQFFPQRGANFPPPSDFATFDTSQRGWRVGATEELLNGASISIVDRPTPQRIFISERHFRAGKTWPKLRRFAEEYGIRVWWQS
jgi:hypothetical protein